MKAVIYHKFAGPLTLEEVPDPTPSDAGVVIEVKATGLCRSDWHGWMGHDPGIAVPNVPGHELAGVVAAVGKGVTKWRVGDRVTLPFVCGCGACPQCASGNEQVCDRQFQPGFTAWGSFAELVAIDFADANLVRLPESMGFVTAASLGCRFATAFRAVVDQGKVTADQWVAVHGCGGVGLSAVMIANALGAKAIAIDIDDDKLQFARSLGAAETINASKVDSVIDAVMQRTSGGAHASLDALGNPTTCFNSVACLRKRGRHVQVGLMLAEQSRPAIPMDRVVADELEIVATHGMPAHGYPRMLDMIADGRLKPDQLIGKTISLHDAAIELAAMNRFKGVGVTVVDRFSGNTPR